MSIELETLDDLHSLSDNLVGSQVWGMGKGKKRQREKDSESQSHASPPSKQSKKTVSSSLSSSGDHSLPLPQSSQSSSRPSKSSHSKPHSHSSRPLSSKSSSRTPSAPTPTPMVTPAEVPAPTPPPVSDSKWNYVVEYNDHFETPQQAYVDLLHVLLSVAKDCQKSLEDLVVYDPYYCEGRMIQLLRNIGIRNVINQNRDFYQDIVQQTLPEYDILVTNPPYSGDHKSRLLSYLHTISKPFALLLPLYTATKSYWKEFVENEKKKWNPSPPLSSSVLYLLPPIDYEYTHPEGTGKDLPPFYSAWFIGGFFSSLNKLRISCSSPLSLSASPSLTLPSSCSFHCLTVLNSVESLISRGYVTDSAKRPNPKQRKKTKMKNQSSNNQSTASQSIGSQSTASQSASSKSVRTTSRS